MGIAAVTALLLSAALVSDDPHPPIVTVGVGPDKKVVAGPSGMALYTYDGNGTSTDCVDACAQAWPALLARPEDQPIGEWAPKPKSGGGLQWAYKGDLVYTHAGDRTPGVASGDGISEAWHAMTFVGPTPQVMVPASAQVLRLGADFLLTDYRGLTLYTFTRDTRLNSACVGPCVTIWPPLIAPQLSGSVGDWTPFERRDGLRQWAWRGRPVYRFNEDRFQGEAGGDGAGGIWAKISIKQGDRGSSGVK